MTVTAGDVPIRKKIHAVMQVWLLWWITYHFIEAFPATADHVEALWVKLLFLSLPLQMLLAILALGFAQGRSEKLIRVGFFLAVANCALIAGHLLITAWVVVRL